MSSVELLEAQISDLQSEASRLIRSLDAQTESGERERREGSKKIEELVREKEARVKEVEGLKERMRQYADYDEVKRELEIMKVRFLVLPSFSYVVLIRLLVGSTSSLREWATGQRTTRSRTSWCACQIRTPTRRTSIAGNLSRRSSWPRTGNSRTS